MFLLLFIDVDFSVLLIYLITSNKYFFSYYTIGNIIMVVAISIIYHCCHKGAFFWRSYLLKIAYISLNK